MRYLSPLRYPGGKASLAPYLVDLLKAQRPRPLIYCEPFAGGAGAALHLLVYEHVDSVIINDINPGIAAFWRCVFNQTTELCDLIRTAEVTLDSWHRERTVYTGSGRPSDLDLGFATFFLNRTNRSGILGARPIGGLDQSGKWKIDARFNREDLVDRIEFVGRYRDRVEIAEQDAIELLAGLDSSTERCFLYVDPPYLHQGPDLYLDTLTWEDHVRLATELRSRHPLWMLTYDTDERVTDELYPGLRAGWFDIAHTAARQHVGKEFFVYSDAVEVKTLDGLSTSGAGWGPTRS